MDFSKLQNKNASSEARSGHYNEAFSFLVARATHGNKEALVELCQTITKGILFRTTRILGNQTDAEDVTQEILIKVCTHIQELREPAAFYVWLNSIIMNETNRYLARNSKHGVLVNIEDFQNDFIEANEDFLPQENTLRESDRKSVIAIIDTLPEQQRKAVLLYYYDGLTLAESAKVMGVSQPRVSRCIKFAQDKIKKELTKWSKGAEGAVLGFAALPLDIVLTQALHQEAALFVNANTLFADGMISSFASKAGGAAQAAAGNAGTSSSNASSAGSNAGTFATIAVAIAVSAGVFFATPLVTGPPDPPPAIVAEYEVSLSGGATDREYVNPKQAVASARDVDDEGLMKANSWAITAEGADEVLFSGDGGVVDEALSRLIESGENGVYIISFEMEDKNGNTWTLSREFAVETSG
jgi:RNA polymerase sigma factor (sigma-70 family)